VKGSKLIFLLAGICFFNCKAQNSAVWENYKSAKEKGTEAILPDFSYAGYKYSEEAIPFINHYKVFDITEFGAAPNDQKSDKAALIKAIGAAKKKWSRDCFFSKRQV
jgi:monomeric isocitrate dehydrogenase